MSPEGRDLLRQLLEPNPARRIPLACVLAHPWFLRNLPPGYTQLNEALLVWRCLGEHGNIDEGAPLLAARPSP